MTKCPGNISEKHTSLIQSGLNRIRNNIKSSSPLFFSILSMIPGTLIKCVRRLGNGIIRLSRNGLKLLMRENLNLLLLQSRAVLDSTICIFSSIEPSSRRFTLDVDGLGKLSLLACLVRCYLLLEDFCLVTVERSPKCGFHIVGVTLSDPSMWNRVFCGDHYKRAYWDTFRPPYARQILFKAKATCYNFSYSGYSSFVTVKYNHGNLSIQQREGPPGG